MGSDVSRNAQTVGESIEVIMEHVMGIAHSGFRIPAYIPTPGNLRARQAVETLDSILSRVIDDRRKNPTQGNDFLSMLISATDSEGTHMSDEQLRSEVATMFVAGHETTALALTYTWYLLSTHPLVARRLREEVTKVLGRRSATYDDLQSLPYTEAIIKESLRLLPPAWAMGREAMQDVVVAGYEIPAGAQLMMAQCVVHRDPRWFPNPEGFMPERWLEDQDIPRFAYFPFGGGSRACIGKSFAMMEAILVLATMAQHYDFHLRPGYQLVRVASITARPKFGMPMRLVQTKTPPLHVSDGGNDQIALG
jgi:cytochrome P450